MALCFPLFALASDVVAGQVNPSPILWYVLLGICVVAALPLAIQAYRDAAGPPPPPVPAPGGPGAGTPPSLRPGDFVIFDGGRTGSVGSAMSWLVTGVILGAMPGALLYAKRADGFLGPYTRPSAFHDDPVPVLIASFLYVLVIMVGAFLAWRGKWRGSLSISPDQIVVRRTRSQIVLNRSELMSVEVRKIFWNGTWLLAKVPPNSVMLTAAPTMSMYDAKLQALKICQLDALQAQPYAVRAALAR